MGEELYPDRTPVHLGDRVICITKDNKYYSEIGYVIRDYNDTLDVQLTERSVLVRMDKRDVMYTPNI